MLLNAQHTELPDFHGVSEPNLPECKFVRRLLRLSSLREENCLISALQIRDYFWNDADCLGYETGLNHYICTKPCADCKSQN